MSARRWWAPGLLVVAPLALSEAMAYGFAETEALSLLLSPGSHTSSWVLASGVAFLALRVYVSVALPGVVAAWGVVRLAEKVRGGVRTRPMRTGHRRSAPSRSSAGTASALLGAVTARDGVALPGPTEHDEDERAGRTEDLERPLRGEGRQEASGDRDHGVRYQSVVDARGTGADHVRGQRADPDHGQIET